MPALAAYRLEEPEICVALQLRPSELRALAAPCDGLAEDAAWAGLIFALLLALGVGITAPGAQYGMLFALICLISAQLAWQRDRDVLTIGMAVGVAAGAAQMLLAAGRAPLAPTLGALAIASSVAALLLALRVGRRARRRGLRTGAVLTRLLRDVARFHDAVDLAVLQEQLAEHGAAPAPSESLHRALAATRQSLQRALAVHGAMRAHAALLRRAAIEPAGRFFPESVDRIALDAQQCAEVLASELEAVAAARLEG